MGERLKAEYFHEAVEDLNEARAWIESNMSGPQPQDWRFSCRTSFGIDGADGNRKTPWRLQNALAEVIAASPDRFLEMAVQRLLGKAEAAKDEAIRELAELLESVSATLTTPNSPPSAPETPNAESAK